MKTSIITLFFLSVIVSSVFFSATAFADQDNIKKLEIPEYAKVFSTESNFEDAKDDLLEAIASHGLVVSYTSHAENMLANTAEVSGVNKAVYSNAEILLFCKANLSHALVAANPHNIVLCPYSIAIYVLTDEPELVYLSYRTVAASNEKIKALTKPIEDLLRNIIEEVI